MRYSERYQKQTVPEWKSCYLNYNHLKKIVKIIRQTVRQRLYLQDLIQQGSRQQVIMQQVVSVRQIPIPQQQMTQINQYHQYFHNKSVWANELFCSVHDRNMKLFNNFVLFKFNQIKANLQLCSKFHFTGGQINSKKGENYFKHYLQNLFTQSMYLSRMMQSCIEAERRMLNKHKLYATNIFVTPRQLAQSELKIDQCHKLRRKIQRFYFKTINKQKHKNRWRLRKLAQQRQIRPSQTLLIGLLTGTILTIIVFMCIILARSSITLQSDPIFNMDFPMWRGIALIIFYIWGFGIMLHFFQKYNVNFRVIFDNHQNQTPLSSDIFKISSFFSVIFIIFFVLYSLQIADIIQTYYFAPQWFALFPWALFILFLFNPLPIFSFDGRVFFFKLVIKMFSTYIFSSTFPAVFITANTLSLLNVFQDFVYTFCYFTHLNLPFPIQQVLQQNTCRPTAILARFIYTIVIYSIRMAQCLRNGIMGNRIQFLNLFKFSLALLTAILAYLWKDVNNSTIFPAWLTFAIISTLGSFAWDMKIGWDLLHKKSKNFLLRDELIYPKCNYYVWTLINFVLRFAWTLNISPNIVRSLFIGPELFTLSFGFLQIFRRCMWNLVRVQVFQIKNNNSLSALPGQQAKFQKFIKKQVKQKEQKLSQVSLQRLYETEKQIFIEQEIIEPHDFQKQKQKIINQIKQMKKQNEEQQQYLKTITQQVFQKVAAVIKSFY